MKDKSKYYYDNERNKDIKQNKEFNTLRNKNIPRYYIGINGMECRSYIDSFEMSYHIGSCCKYISRASGRTVKHDDFGVSDIKKAITHLTMELERIKKYKGGV